MTGVCPRPLSTAVGFWADSVVVGFLVVCFCCWSWVWSGGAVPLLRLLGRYLGYSPVPGGLHLAVHRGNDQHYEGHTLAEPPSWASQGHSPGSLPSPPPFLHLPPSVPLVFPRLCSRRRYCLGAVGVRCCFVISPLFSEVCP